jgi:hypothetical protein
MSTLRRITTKAAEFHTGDGTKLAERKVGVHHLGCVPPLPTVHRKCPAGKGTKEENCPTRNEGPTATGKTTRKKVKQKNRQASP